MDHHPTFKVKPYSITVAVAVVALFYATECGGQLMGFQHLIRRNQEFQVWSNYADALVIANESEISNDETDPKFLLPYDRQRILSELLSELTVTFALPSSVSSTGRSVTNISQQCLTDSLHFLKSLTVDRSNWALKMVESSAVLPVGILGGGNYHAEGLFDECLSVRAPQSFRGKYCSIFFRPEPVRPTEVTQENEGPNNNESLQSGRSSYISSMLRRFFGPSVGEVKVEPKTAKADGMTYVMPSLSLCVPSSCNASDLGQVISHLIGSYVIANQSIVTIADDNYCLVDSSETPTIDGATIAVLVTFGVLGLLVLLATVHDAWRSYHGSGFDAKMDSGIVTGLHCFSALSNGRKLLSLDPASSGSDNLSCLHGIRFFSTCWVVIGHTWLKSAMSNVLNPKMVTEEAMSWQMESIINATVSVDTFFVMSGLLVSFVLLRELDRNAGKCNVAMLYLHRYLRLTPVYAVILGFIATLMVYIGTGPYWYNVVLASEGCRETWWKQFLYINNMFSSEMSVQCMGETWYLAVDMQLFLLAPLFIYPLWRWKKAGIALLSFFTLASLAANFAVYVIYKFPPTLMPTRMKEMFEFGTVYMNNYYFKPWIRAPPYFIGIWTGWYLHRIKNSKLNIPSGLVVVLWMAAAAIGGSIVYGLTPYLDETLVPTIDEAVKLSYGPIHRAAWAVALSWIIVACVHGYGGFVDHLLSWRGFLPLSRLTYCVFLIHYDYLNVFYSLNRRMLYYTFTDQLTTFFGITVTVFGLAFIVAVTVEASFFNLEKWIFSSAIKSKPNDMADGTDDGVIRSINTLNQSSEDVEQISSGGHINPAFISGEGEIVGIGEQAGTSQNCK